MDSVGGRMNWSLPVHTRFWPSQQPQPPLAAPHGPYTIVQEQGGGCPA